MSEAPPLVSVLIPAYHDRFFAEALASARAQTWPALEIVVLDDSPGRAIEQEVRQAGDARVRYARNSPRRGFAGNFTALFEAAQGEYVKFLNDDDRLRPECVAELAGALRANPGITLATSRRIVIDAAGVPQPDLASTVPLAHVSAFVPGRELGDFVLMNSLNLIGEPTTAMFRRSQLSREEGPIFRWGGRDYHCLADLSLWLRLLARGAAFYSAVPLSEYRHHAGQEQGRGEVRADCNVERLEIARQARASGFLSAPAQWLTALQAIHARAAATDFTAAAPRDAERMRALMSMLGDEIAAARR